MDGNHHSMTSGIVYWISILFHILGCNPSPHQVIWSTWHTR